MTAVAAGQRGHVAGNRQTSYAPPDINWGYGFPIGGVAATDVAQGWRRVNRRRRFQHSCGVGLLATTYKEEEVQSRLKALMALYRRVPAGTGAGRIWRPGDKEFPRARKI